MRVDDFYDRHPINAHQVLAAVARRRGGDLARLSADDLFEFDQDHYGGLAAVDALARRAAITAASRVRDASALPFREGSFDACVSQEAFQHIADKLAVLAGCRRVLAPGGRLAFTDW